jgi:environmental stress-induced protein Ves
MRIIRAHEQRAMPWKNGGGATYEIVVYPEGAGIDTFEWRLSMADVKTDGPFSLFPGIDRSLGIVTGNGLTLRIAGRGDIEVRLGAPSPLFRADVETSGDLVEGPVLDLNMMTRRALWSHHMREWTADKYTGEKTPGSIQIIIALEGRLKLGEDTLDPRDAVIVAPDEPAPTIEASAARFAHIDLWRNA